MKRKISIILTIILLFSFTASAFATVDELDRDPGGGSELGNITDFEKLREYIRNSKGQSDFKTNKDKDYFRHTYWDTVLPDESEPINFKAIGYTWDEETKIL